MKSILKSKTFYAGLTTIVVGFFALMAGNTEQGIITIIAGIATIAGRIAATKQVFVKRPKTTI